jgi:hypothetical protein
MRALFLLLVVSISTQVYADFYTGKAAKEVLSEGRIIFSVKKDVDERQVEHLYNVLVTYKGQVFDCYVQSMNDGKLFTACKDDYPLSDLDENKPLPDFSE